MNDPIKLPEELQAHIAAYNDDLSAVLTSWEQGEISDFELYDFMVETQRALAFVEYE